MQYDTTTQELDLPLIDLCPDRPLPAGLSRAKGWGWGFDPVEVEKINEKRIAQGLKPLSLPEGMTR